MYISTHLCTLLLMVYLLQCCSFLSCRFFSIVKKVISIGGAIKKLKEQETNTKNEAQKIKSDYFTRRNREKSNIYYRNIVIPKLFCYLYTQLLFSPIVILIKTMQKSALKTNVFVK